MKKLLFTAISALSICALADNADSRFVSGTTFTGKTSGTAFAIGEDDGTPAYDADQDTQWWATSGATSGDVEGVYTNAGDLATYPLASNRPTQWAGENEAIALQITDASVPLYRNIKDTKGDVVDFKDPTAEPYWWDLTSDGAITFDSLVLFTAADGAPSLDAEDKLVVWLLGEEEGDNPQTNLMITAGYHLTGDTMVSTNYVVNNVNVMPGEWNRLTIAVDTVTPGENPTAQFTVYVNGTKVVAKTEDESAETYDSFYSRVQPTETEATRLAGVGFKGTGAVDDLTFTTVNPFVAPEQKYFSAGEKEYLTFAEAVADNATEITLLQNYDASQEEDGYVALNSGTVTLTIGTYNINNTGDSSAIDVEGGALTVLGTGIISGGTDASAVYVGADGTVVFGTSAGGVPAINGSIYVEEGATVKYLGTPTSIALEGDGSPAWSKEPDEDGYYTIVFGGGGETPTVTPGGSAVVDSAEAAAAVTISAPTDLTGKALETYQGYFTKNVSGPDGGKYTVTAVLNSDGTNALETATASATTGTVFNAVSTLLTGSDLSKSETVSGLEPGFYYSIDSGSALGTLTHPAGQLCSGSGSVTLTVKKFEGSGFYKVIASPTQIESTEPTEP